MTRYFYDKRVREIFWQAALLIGLAATIVLVVRNASQNMVNAGMASGFDFLWRTSASTRCMIVAVRSGASEAS